MAIATRACVLHADFVSDVREDATRALIQLGARLPDLRAATDPWDKARLTCAELFHQARRRIARKERDVVWSRELRMRPWSEAMRAVETIAAELSRGDDMNRRLSRSIVKSIRSTVQSRSYDTLVASWGIHHLHVGTAVDKDGFVARTAELLFVLVRGETAYLLDLLDHASFRSERIFRIVHDNWPSIVTPWRVPEITKPERGSAREHRSRRRIRMTMAMEAEARNGVLYLPPGGGVMPSGHSFEATRQAAEVLSLARDAETWCRAQVEALRRRVESETGAEARALHLRFDMRRSIRIGSAVVREARTGVTFVVP